MNEVKLNEEKGKVERKIGGRIMKMPIFK